MIEADIYTDGSAYGDPGPGGWGAIIIIGNVKFELSGGTSSTDNNIMEMTAIIKALELLNGSYIVNIYTDSGFICDVFNEKIFVKWLKNGWINSNKEKVSYKKLWKRLLKLAKNHKFNIYHVKSHAGHEFNEKCDALAKVEAQKYIKEPQYG